MHEQSRGTWYLATWCAADPTSSPSLDQDFGLLQVINVVNEESLLHYYVVETLARL
jgi:hypothetical protein